MHRAITLSLSLTWIATAAAVGQDRSDPASAPVAPSPAKVAAQSELKEKLSQLKTLQADVKRLRRTGGIGPQQILLHVQVMQVSQTDLEAAGYHSGKVGIVGLLSKTSAERQPPPGQDATKRPSTRDADGQGEFAVFDCAGDSIKLLQDWKQKQFVKVLAEPTLATLDGRPVSFNMGGEIPVLATRRNGTVGIQYRRYGTEFGATPCLLDDGAVRLELRPRFRKLDPKHTVMAGSQRIPAIHVRELDAVVRIRPGEMLLMNGPAELTHKDRVVRGKTVRDVERLQTLISASAEIADSVSAPVAGELPSSE